MTRDEMVDFLLVYAAVPRRGYVEGLRVAIESLSEEDLESAVRLVREEVRDENHAGR